MSVMGSKHNDRAPDVIDSSKASSMELFISYVLRVGVILGAGTMLLGVLLLAATKQTGYGSVSARNLAALLAYHPAGGTGHFPTAPLAVLRAALLGKPYAIIALGLLVLIATPVARVALSAVFFGFKREWLYVAITIFVLGVLVASFIVGTASG
jgi:uncharacterized membrane protein